MLKRIVVLGDVHMAVDAVDRVPDLESADLVIVNGDLTNFGHYIDAEPLIHRLLLRNPRVLALHGNLDHPDVEDFLIRKGISLHGKGRQYGDIGLFGVGGSNITPFRTPTEYTEEELERYLNMGYESVSDCRFLMLVCHTPPARTSVDRIRSGIHVGSQAVRTFIERVQPSLCVVGHIHEAAGTDRIGITPILNPGMLKDSGWVEITANENALEARLQSWF